jgi:hypothetical protein
LRNFPEQVKREVASEYGCSPGRSVDVPCTWCEKIGTIHWPATDRVVGRVRLQGLEWDHFVAIARGGKSDRDNCSLACIRCNRRKKDKSIAEWFEWRNPAWARSRPDIIGELRAVYG